MCYKRLSVVDREKWLGFMKNEIFVGDDENIINDMCRIKCDDEYAVFVCVENDCIIGSLKVDVLEIDVCNKTVQCGILSGVGVKAAFRGQGIAKQLLSMCDEFLNQKGVSIVHLYSKENTYNFYLKMGYRSVNKKENEDFYRMYRVISPFCVCDYCVSDTNALVDMINKNNF